MGVVRAFVAVKTDAAAQSVLGEVINVLSATRADVKWIHDFNLHITIKFLGDIEREDLEKVIKGLEEAVKSFKPMSLAINGVDVIPNIRYPRVVCASLGGDTAGLTGLAHTIESELFNLGIPKEAREFFPHITLGRVKSFKAKSKLIMELRRFHKNELAGMVVDEIHLIKSELKPGGAIYEDLAAFPLT
jgi:2'-5' RNA ligase